MIHELKTWPKDFVAVRAGKKAHEARLADRPFAVGDDLVLLEWIPQHPERCQWKSPYDEQQTDQNDFFCRLCQRKKADPLPGKFTGNAIMARVTHLTQAEYGLPSDLAIMSIPHATAVVWDETEGAWGTTTWDIPFRGYTVSPEKTEATLRHILRPR